MLPYQSVGCSHTLVFVELEPSGQPVWNHMLNALIGLGVIVSTFAPLRLTDRPRERDAVAERVLPGGPRASGAATPNVQKAGTQPRGPRMPDMGPQR